jgi:hypothetical protein
MSATAMTRQLSSYPAVVYLNGGKAMTSREMNYVPEDRGFQGRRLVASPGNCRACIIPRCSISIRVDLLDLFMLPPCRWHRTGRQGMLLQTPTGDQRPASRGSMGSSASANLKLQGSLLLQFMWPHSRSTRCHSARDPHPVRLVRSLRSARLILRAARPLSVAMGTAPHGRIIIFTSCRSFRWANPTT